jgi:peptidyl-tRNA hydrolase, PTH1 family
LWAVVGLGNPGRRYAQTKHNVGFLFIRQVARNWKVRVKKRRFQAKIAEVERAQGKILLAMPQTFMNLSGQAVKQIVGGRKIELENLVVVYDDLDIPMGDIRVRKEGSAGTHKGMTSVIQELGSGRFPRIRVGIGPLPAQADAAEYVLSPLAPGERRLIDQILLQAEEALGMILEGKIDEAMNRFNQKGQGL